MPGSKSITWTEANKAKAFDALIYYARPKIDKDTADKIAAHMGGGLEGNAINVLFKNVAQRFKPANGAAERGGSSRAPVSSPRVLATGGISRSRPRKVVRKNPEQAEEFKQKLQEAIEEGKVALKQEQEETPPPPASPSPTPRESRSRSNRKVDYRALLKSHGLDDEGVESAEGSDPSDAEYSNNAANRDDDDDEDMAF